MKANELMIGDWVFVNDVEHLRPMQVGEIKRESGKHYACLYDPNDVSEHCECVVDKVNGIRVVGTVLKKNLFMFNPRDYSWVCEVNNNEIYITETLNGARVSIDVHGCNTSIFNFPVKYLHELQHLCAMCNIKIDWKA